MSVVISRTEAEQARKLGFARAEVARLDKVISEAACKRAVYQQALDEVESSQNQNREGITA